MEELSQTDEAQYIREGLQEEKDPVRQNGGYKATLSSTCCLTSCCKGSTLRTIDTTSDPQVSEEAKQHARDILEERDAL